MSSVYTTQRVLFNKLTQKYLEYVSLYKELNGGSLDGVTPFHEFYWNMVYYSRYANGKRPGQGS